MFYGAVQDSRTINLKFTPSKIKSLFQKCTCGIYLKKKKEIVCGFEDGRIRVYDLDSGKRLKMIKNAHFNPVASRCSIVDIIEHASEDMFITSGKDKKVKIWNQEDYTVHHEFTVAEVANCVRICANEDYFVAGGENGAIMHFYIPDCEQMNLLRQGRISHGIGVTRQSLTCIHDMTRLSSMSDCIAIAGEEKYLGIWDLKKSMLVYTFLGMKTEVIAVTTYMRDVDERKEFILASNLESIFIYDLKSKCSISRVFVGAHVVKSYFVCQGRFLFCGCSEGVVQAYCLITYKRIFQENQISKNRNCECLGMADLGDNQVLVFTSAVVNDGNLVVMDYILPKTFKQIEAEDENERKIYLQEEYAEDEDDFRMTFFMGSDIVFFKTFFL